MKLHEVVALEKAIKPRTYAEVTKAHHGLQKAAPLSGISRTYQPLDDEGEQFPPEQTKVQVKAGDLINAATTALTELFDVTFTKDAGNMVAVANVTVDGQIVLANAPVPYLLFLEKQLTDLATLVAKLPVLDPAETWSYDEVSDEYRTEPSKTIKTKKVPRNHVLAEATDRHPAQVNMYMEDVLVGNWTTVKFSGALPQARVNELKARVAKLADAVKVARQQANDTTVDFKNVGRKILDYVFAS